MRAWLVLALLLAGCADSPAPTSTNEAIHDEDPAAPPRVEAEANQTVEQVNASVTLSVTQVSAVGAGFSFGGPNCANFDVDEVLGGTATATWSAVPGLESIELGMLGENTRDRVTGTSPLTFDLPRDLRHDFFESVMVFAQAPDPGVLIEQEVQVEIEMEFIGGSGDHGFSGCSIG